MEDAAKDYAAGFAAGVATVLIGHPFDTVKVKLQTQNTEVNTTKYRNAVHCVLGILKTEGVRGFYRGATSSFVGVALESSVLFGVYSQMRSALQGREGGEPELLSIIPAAAVGGACISMILCPTELVKCRLQVQVGNGSATSLAQRYDGPLDCLQKTVKTDGVQGLFRGGLSTLLRECTGNAFFFTTYECTRYRLLTALEYPGESKSQSTTAEPWKQLLYGKNYSKIMVEGAVDVLSGGLAGMAFWTAVLPFDVAKTRIQTALDLNFSRNPFTNLKMIYTDLGTRGLYAGLGPTLMRAFPANAVAMLTWELTAKLLGVRRKEH